LLPLFEPDDFEPDLEPDELLEPDEPPLLAPDEPLLFEPDEPPLLEPDDPPLFEPEDEPPLRLLPPPDDPPLLRDEADPPLFEPLLRVEDDPPLFEPLLRVDDEPPPDFDPDERELPPLFEVAARAAAAPTAAPAAAPAAVARGFLRRDVLRCSLSPRPALKPTVVRSGILISVPVRGLRPLRAARVRRVNFPNPGMDSDPAAWTASEMAPDAVSKIASTTRAAAALVSSAFSATVSMNSDLFMFALRTGGLRGAARPRPGRHTQTRFHRVLPATIRDRLGSRRATAG
jgi:hypothetical protein